MGGSVCVGVGAVLEYGGGAVVVKACIGGGGRVWG